MPIAGTAAERIALLCAEASASAPAEHREGLARLHTRLGQPLHIAVAGRVKAGKSTFVNAVLGQRVARTDARECTRVVTWFRYGPTERVTVVARDGSRGHTRLGADGLVPEDLGMPVEQVAAVEVELSLARLRAFTLADTPGLDSPDTGVSRATEGVLGIDPDSQTVMAEAEAVLFVMNQTVRQSDVDVLRAIRALSRSAGNDVVSAFAVLNKADLFDAQDPIAEGRRIAARYAAELSTELAGVFAYSGLFAEVALCGLFTEDDAVALEQLAALDAAKRERMLLAESSFCRSPTPTDVSASSRRRLWALLREAGLRDVFQAVDAGAAGAVALRKHLVNRSGHQVVDAHIGELFEANAAALKATAALEHLETLAWRVGADWGTTLRDRIEALRLDPVLHVVAELAALRQVRRRDVVLPASLADELVELVSTPMAARAGTAAGLRRWQAHANSDVSPMEAQVARVVIRSYEIASWNGTNP